MRQQWFPGRFFYGLGIYEATPGSDGGETGLGGREKTLLFEVYTYM